MTLYIDKPFKWPLRLRVEATVDRRVDEVFRRITNLALYREWGLPGSVRKTSPGEVGLGTTYRQDEIFDRGWGGRETRHRELEVTEFFQRQRFAFESVTGSLRVRRSFELAEIGGTRTVIAFREEVLHLGLSAVGEWWASFPFPRPSVLARLSLLLKPVCSMWVRHKIVRWLELVHLEKGIELGDIGEWRQAIAELDAAITENPEHAVAYAYRGYAYAELRQTERAIADLERALSLSSDPDLTADVNDAIAELRASG